MPIDTLALQTPSGLDVAMSDTERKGDPPILDHENGNGLVTMAQGQYDSAEDVFGNEEGAQVRREGEPPPPPSECDLLQQNSDETLCRSNTEP